MIYLTSFPNTKTKNELQQQYLEQQVQKSEMQDANSKPDLISLKSDPELGNKNRLIIESEPSKDTSQKLNHLMMKMTPQRQPEFMQNADDDNLLNANL